MGIASIAPLSPKVHELSLYTENRVSIARKTNRREAVGQLLRVSRARGYDPGMRVNATDATPAAAVGDKPCSVR
jgi:hypothetical protein